MSELADGTSQVINEMPLYKDLFLQVHQNDAQFDWSGWPVLTNGKPPLSMVTAEPTVGTFRLAGKYKIKHKYDVIYQT